MCAVTCPLTKPAALGTNNTNHITTTLWLHFGHICNHNAIKADMIDL